MSMAPSIYDAASPNPPDDISSWEMHLRIPELDGVAEDSADAEPAAAAPQPTDGMLVLNRLIDKRSARASWRRSWARRLWLAAMGLMALSALALVVGFLRTAADPRSIDSASADADLYSELANEPPAIDSKPEAGAELAVQAASDAADAVSTAGYETSAEPKLRGAWLAGTIEFDDTPKP